MRFVWLLLLVSCANVGAEYGVCEYDIYKDNVKIDKVLKESYDFECHTKEISGLEYKMIEFKRGER